MLPKSSWVRNRLYRTPRGHKISYAWSSATPLKCARSVGLGSCTPIDCSITPNAVVKMVRHAMWTLFIECRMCDTAVTQCEGDVRETEINLEVQRLRDLVPYFIFSLCCPNSKEIKSDCIPLPEALRALALARYSLICVARPIESCRRIESPFKRTRNLPYIYWSVFICSSICKQKKRQADTWEHSPYTMDFKRKSAQLLYSQHRDG